MNPFSAEQAELLSLKIELNEIKSQFALRKSLFRLQSELAGIKFDIKLRQILRRGDPRWLARVALWADFNTRRIELLLARGGELNFKHGYNPDQPRVPAGNPGGGEWTSGGGSSQTPKRIRLVGEIPANDPPEVPKERPATPERRTAVIKEVARWLSRWGGPLAKIAGAAYWLYQYDAQIAASLDPPKTLEELQRAVATPKAGYEIHHIVEQTPAEQDGYRRSLIDGPENLVRIPTLKHREISAWYQTKNDQFDELSPRDYLRGKTWEERTRVGLGALIDHGVLKP